jgi:hypothetical protein
MEMKKTFVKVSTLFLRDFLFDVTGNLARFLENLDSTKLAAAVKTLLEIKNGHKNIFLNVKCRHDDEEKKMKNFENKNKKTKTINYNNKTFWCLSF